MLLDSIDVNVDFNGIVIFAYPDLKSYFGNQIGNGQNILNDFTQTDLGDKVVDEGVVIPIINIDDGGYLVRFFEDTVDEPQQRRVVFSESGFVLKVDGDLYAADAAVFWDWEEWLGWKKVAVQPGCYSVVLEGVQHLDESGLIARTGYDLILTRTKELMQRTATIREDNRVN